MEVTQTNIIGDIFTWHVLLALFGGNVIGLLVGALPGIGPVTSMAIFLPFTFKLPAAQSFAFLVGMWASGIYAGSWSAILVNVPGTSMSVATCFDGYPMARNGRALEALGAATVSSFLSGLAGAILLLIGGPILAPYVVMFGPPELVWIYILALLLLSTSFGALKGIVSCLLGLSISMVGIDTVIGVPRYTFGTLYLQDGIDLISALVGIFGFAEVIVLTRGMLGTREALVKGYKLSGNLLTGVISVLRYWRTLVLGLVIGTFIGALPGIGAAAGNLMAYAEAKRRSRRPETFGKGNVEGVIVSEASNNIVEGTSMLPALLLGIPGSLAAAVMLAALIIQGFDPGRTLLLDKGFIWDFFLLIASAQVAMLIVGFMFMRLAAYISLLPNEMLAVAIAALCFIGVYSVNNSLWDVVVAIVLGCVGYLMRQHDFPVLGLIVGLILGPLIERALSQSLAISGNSFLIFFNRLPSLVLFALNVFFIVRHVYRTRKEARNRISPHG